MEKLIFLPMKNIYKYRTTDNQFKVLMIWYENMGGIFLKAPSTESLVSIKNVDVITIVLGKKFNPERDLF